MFISNTPLEKEEEKVLEELIKRRVSGEPLQYILGHQEFWSIDLNVDPRVLIPRPETELLVEQALSVLSKIPLEERCSVLEMGTGSGAIAIALAREAGTVSSGGYRYLRRGPPLSEAECRKSGRLRKNRLCSTEISSAPFVFWKEGGLST